MDAGQWHLNLMSAAEELDKSQTFLRDMVIEAAKAGITQRAIAYSADKSPSWVHKVLHEAGITYERKAVST